MSMGKNRKRVKIRIGEGRVGIAFHKKETYTCQHPLLGRKKTLLKKKPNATRRQTVKLSNAQVCPYTLGSELEGRRREFGFQHKSNEGLFKSCNWATITRLLFFFLLKITSNIGEPNGLGREEVAESQRRGVRRTLKGEMTAFYKSMANRDENNGIQ